MLSILIPIYQFDVRPLIIDLLLQAGELDIPYELLCFDDGSSEDIRALNRELVALPGVVYREMPQNLGRSRIRNELGLAAKYEWLLFLDCDSRVVTPDFLQAYLAAAKYRQVVVGKRVYAPAPPSEQAFFRWYYGRQREEKPASERNRAPYHAFCSAHFLVPKSVFAEVRFDPSLEQYGHEDTLFGFDLQRRGIPVLHIDAPLEHIDLEPADEFIEKSKRAVENLAQLARRHPRLETRLLHLHQRLRRWRMAWAPALLYRLFHRSMESNFRSKRPNLRLFDLYKLGYLGLIS